MRFALFDGFGLRYCRKKSAGVGPQRGQCLLGLNPNELDVSPAWVDHHRLIPPADWAEAGNRPQQNRVPAKQGLAQGFTVAGPEYLCLEGSP